ncbi:hypothetical protein QFC22_004528 [Naganishia vaughanmartiniae]|uniref:Uncharacterized protein n=1 Tax=Naganishia vaughanmartiniae TaxID=1424756 RepID=A0ACC2WZR2_9TREE|nr:hypothetical protein QFC22_004528 [Naganishia vaughanmartiniae]
MSGAQPMQVDIIDLDADSESASSSVMVIDDPTMTMDQQLDTEDITRFPLKQQISILLEEIGVKSRNDRPTYIPEDTFDLAFGSTFASGSFTPATTLEGLSLLLGVPGLTDLFIKHFRPILLDLVARWLVSISPDTTSEEWERKMFVLAEISQHEPEAWPVIHAFLEKSPFLEQSPLAFCPEDDSIVAVDAERLHLLLFSYFRILNADPQIGQRNYWKHNALKRLYLAHPDNGVKVMAISVFCLQMEVAELGRRNMEEEVLGEVGGVDANMAYGWRFSAVEEGASIQEESQQARKLEMWHTDAWVIRTMEYRREQRIAAFSNDLRYASEKTISENDFCQHVAVAGDRLLLRHQAGGEAFDKIIHVETAATHASLTQIARSLSLGLPILITSPQSAGKTHIVNYLSTLMYPSTPLNSRVLTISLADTSIDAKALLGSYVSSPMNPGTFTWTEGALTKAVRGGRWVILEDIDKAGQEVLSLFSRLADSMSLPKHVGSRAQLDIPGRQGVEAGDGFALIAMRTVTTIAERLMTPAIFLGHNYFKETLLASPTDEDLQSILDFKYPRLSGSAAQVLVKAYHDLKDIERATGKVLPGSGAARSYGLRDLEKWCARVENMLPKGTDTAMHMEGEHLRFSNPVVQDEVFLEALDVFLAAAPSSVYDKARGRRDVIAEVLSESLGLSAERREHLLNQRKPSLEVSGDARARQSSIVRIGRTSLNGLAPRPGAVPATSRPYALTKPSAILLERIAVSIVSAEPVLLVGETGTGKTTAVQYMATTLNRPLTAINLSTQTESSDLLGGFKPVDAAVTARQVYAKWLDLFRQTFSRKKNEKIEQVVRKSMSQRKWDQLVKVWLGTVPVAKQKLEERLQLRAPNGDLTTRATGDVTQDDEPRKRRKLADDEVPTEELERQLAGWISLDQDIQRFNMQHVKSTSRLVFSFVEGPLVQALRNGEWILLDEINLASSETLEALSTILESSTSSVVLTERGDLEPVERHPDFRLFACMNPATDVGKKDLPPGLRARFTEIYAPPPDDDEDALRGIVKQYLGDAVAGDRSAIADVAEFYSGIKAQARHKEIVDGTNTPPHFSMRTLARALMFAVEVSPSFGIRRGLWEGLLMTFTMSLDTASYDIARKLCAEKVLRGMRNVGARFGGQPAVPDLSRPDDFVLFGDYWLEKGPEPVIIDEKYIKTPSVANKLADLARIIMTRKLPVLIQGPTSSGKTSAVEFLAKQTGHRFVRINNHEHTDIQEYLGTYASDPVTGNLVFREGVLVTAVRNGYWLVLDELNLAPTDVLEALNRLLDDNRELVLPETGEVVRPHPHFMLFATQNPPGLYAGRKVLSRAFRNRFLEVHFEDVPQEELQEILHRRSDIAPTYARLIVEVFRELQHRRQATRVFESRQSFATLRDLFRWAGRDAISHQQLAENGYLLLAERARKEEDRLVVKEVLEKKIKAKIDENTLLQVNSDASSAYSKLGLSLPDHLETNIVWTKAMQRLFTLVAAAAANDEPILLVGETGSGKTSVCEVIAALLQRQLISVSCHQNMETADLLGSQRPVRNRGAKLALIAKRIEDLCQTLQIPCPEGDFASIEGLFGVLSALAQDARVEAAKRQIDDLRSSVQQASALFEWSDGPLVHAMQEGSVLLLDELSLADDSVLERLNSVLEPAKVLVLAEKGGASDLDCTIVGHAGFQVIATMNPGGDFGKKELSPALRNRFTEIWVPAVTDRDDLEQIINRSFRLERLRSCTPRILDFLQWFSDHVVDQSQTGIGLRDILAWVAFSNACADGLKMSTSDVFTHAAKLVIVDGLETLPSVSALGRERLADLRRRCLQQLATLANALPVEKADTSAAGPSEVSISASKFSIGPFSISRGSVSNRDIQPFAMEAPTTMENLLRVVRACQLPKSILLEGSPGVGKTSLVQALADSCDRLLCRINLSDQTDLIDLFGSDLPVSGGAAGEFAWQDAAFLTAMQNGDWVLLDEMNLASQAVLEGLNAVLDHRGSVYVPELDRTFVKHPEFKLFAAQNPVQQGGGRKGLPKSFLNRFTKVYVQEHTPEDLVFICQRIFPQLDEGLLKKVIQLNEGLYHATMIQRQFGQEGGPWEFNLRDIIRLFRLYLTPNGFEGDEGLSGFLQMVYVNRFRTEQDQRLVCHMIKNLFTINIDQSQQPWMYISKAFFQVGFSVLPRSTSTGLSSVRQLVSKHHQQYQSLLKCISAGWLAILVGPTGCGKRSALRSIASLSGTKLYEYSMHPGVDTMEMLGTFEQSDSDRQLISAAKELLDILTPLELEARSLNDDLQDISKSLRTYVSSPELKQRTLVIRSARRACEMLAASGQPQGRIQGIQAMLDQASASSAPSFEWIDGPLVAAIKQGHWFCINDANLCSPSVLDRLNSLCEMNGTLALSEKGSNSGQTEILRPHGNFRLFLSYDSLKGELSRAMRNRGIEIAFFRSSEMEEIVEASSSLRSTLLQQSSAEAYNILQAPEIGNFDRSSPYTPNPAVLARIVTAHPLDNVRMVHRTVETGSPALAQAWKTFIHSLDSASLVEIAQFNHSRLVLHRHLSDVVCSLLPLDLGLNPQFLGLVQERALTKLVQLIADISYVKSEGNNGRTQVHTDATQHSKIDFKSLSHLAVLSDRVSSVGLACLKMYNSAEAASEKLSIVADVGCLVGILREIIGLLKAQDFQHAAVKVYIQLLEPLFADMHDVALSAAMEELKTFVEPTTGLAQAVLWKALLLADNEKVEHQVSQLMGSLMHTDASLLSTTGILQIAALIKARKLHAAAAEAEFSKLRQALDKMIPSQAVEPADFEIRLGRSMLTQLVSYCQTYAEADIMQYTAVALHVDVSSITPLPSLVALRTVETTPALYFDMLSSYLKGLWVEVGEGIRKEWLIQPGHLQEPLDLSAVIGASINASAQVGELDRYASSRRLTSQALVWKIENDKSSNLQALMKLGWRTLHMVARIVTLKADLQPKIWTGNIENDIDNLTILDTITLDDEVRKTHPSLVRHLTRIQEVFQQTSISEIYMIGRLWIILGQAIIELFVPDVPLDPTVEEDCQQRIYLTERAQLQSELDSYSEAENQITGNRTTTTIDSIKLDVKMNAEKLVLSRKWDHEARNEKLSAFYQEVHRFLRSILQHEKIDRLAHTLSHSNYARDSALAEEENFQAASHAFVNRLEEAYGVLHDLVQPLCTAVQSIRLGLRVIAKEAIRQQAATDAQHHVVLVNLLTSFPSISALEDLAADRQDRPPSRDTASELLLQLRSINMLSNAGHPVTSIASNLDVLYSRISALWRIDQEAIKRQEQITESLYRQKTTQEEVESDDAIEARELAQLFPIYDDDEEPPHNPQLSVKKTGFVRDDDILGVYRSHLSLFRLSKTETEQRAWNTTRKSTIDKLLVGHRLAFDSDLDKASRAYQLLALDEENQEGTTSQADLQYNFYTSPNRQEIAHSLHLMRRLRARLTVILEEWPDQIRLQHIIDRCDFIQSMKATSPVARILSAMEQLLEVVQDWEQYANRDNSLASFRDEIIALIIEWRKMELSAWNRLLDQELHLYDAENAIWWFRLYELIILGTDSIVTSYEGVEREDKLQLHIKSSLPLLTEYISATSCGHFGSRLRLLGSFADLIEATKMTADDAFDSWRTVVHVLRNIEASYGQYIEGVQQSINNQRTPLEKSVRDFIKLASWKDVNVNAMQASARKSHAQLYKTVRKFRDILRQPVSPFLTAILSPLPAMQVPTSPSCEVILSSDYAISDRPGELVMPSFLADAKRTIQRFQKIMVSDEQPDHDAAYELEEIATDIIETAEAFTKETPAHLTKENTKNVKNLQMRKRKAFSDLLKELRRLGFSAKVRADQMANQTDATYILKLTPVEANVGLESTARETLSRVEQYHHRLDFALPAMRHALTEHSADIVTHDLQRAHGFAESVFAEALESRKNLISAAHASAQLRAVAVRLSQLAANGIGYAHRDLLTNLRLLERQVLDLSDAGVEAARVVRALCTLKASGVEHYENIAVDIGKSLSTLQPFLVILRKTVEISQNCGIMLLSQDEMSKVEKLSQTLSGQCEAMEGISSKTVALGFVTQPLAEMARKAKSTIDTLPFSLVSAGDHDLWAASDKVIEKTLIVAQTFGKDTSDKELNTDVPVCAASQKMLSTQFASLRYADIRDRVADFTNTLTSVAIDTGHARSQCISAIQSLLPYLNGYNSKLERHLATHAAWSKALYKLDYVLVRTFTALSLKGFCKPQEADDQKGSGQEGQMEMDGTGLGSGSGEQNVSNEIEDESQVEGLRGEKEEEEEDQPKDRNGDNDAVEMQDDFEGALEDAEEEEKDENQQEEEDDGEEEKQDMDEHVGDVGEDAVDDQFWGDDDQENQEDGNEDKLDKDQNQQQGESEMAAKEKEESSSKDKKESDKQNEEGQAEQETEQQDDDADGDQQEQGEEEELPEEGAGAALDSTMPEVETLDLPEEMDLDDANGSDQLEDFDDDGMDGDDAELEGDDAPTNEAENEDDGDAAEQEGDQGEAGDDQAAEDAQSLLPQEPNDEGNSGDTEAQNGVGAQGGLDNSDSKMDQDQPENETEDQDPEAVDDAQEGKGAKSNARQDAGAGDESELNPTADGQGPADENAGAPDNSRSKGDLQKDVHRLINEILERSGDRQPQEQDAERDLKQVEHIQDDEKEDMQALGASHEEQQARLADLAIVDDEEPPANDMEVMRANEDMQDIPPQAKGAPPPKQENGDDADADEHKALTQAQISGRQDQHERDLDLDADMEGADDEEMDDGKPKSAEDAPDSKDLELSMKKWIDSGRSGATGEEIWREYSALTSDLSYHLCEQLRLILQPTLATRLQGDYRTGKRLNMRKIIPYIASEYTKDKIWLRRTKPSRREYQVLLSLDDSRSMADSHSVHLAYQTLALVSQALTKLEVGQVGIARFGEEVEMLHEFSDTAFSAADGAKVMNSFTFGQHKTDVAKLVSDSLDVLAQARQSSVSSSSADLWQLEIIISDGVCQDHEKLRKLLRRAMEDRVMIVFLVVDSLAQSTPAVPGAAPASRTSILNMQSAAYKEINGAMQLEMTRYLDTFPFEYFVVLRDVEALPEVLSETLRQWIARVAMSQE